MEEVDINKGVQGFQCRNVAYNLGAEVAAAKQIAVVIFKLYSIFRKYGVTKNGSVQVCVFCI